MATDQLFPSSGSSGQWSPTNDSLAADVVDNFGVSCDPGGGEAVVEFEMQTREVGRVTEVLVEALVDATDNAGTGATLTAELLSGGAIIGASSLASFDPDYAVANEPASGAFGVSWGQAELDGMALRFTVAGGGSAWKLKVLAVTITYIVPGGGGTRRIGLGMGIGL